MENNLALTLKAKPKRKKTKKQKKSTEMAIVENAGRGSVVQLLEKRIEVLEKQLLRISINPKMLTQMMLKTTKNSHNFDPMVTKSIDRIMENMCNGLAITNEGLCMLQAMLNPCGETMGSAAPNRGWCVYAVISH